MKSKKLVRVYLSLYIPEGATHYMGSLPYEAVFFKCGFAGIADVHWFRYSPIDDKWILHSNIRPKGMKHLEFV